MSDHSNRYDYVVVGAGSAGAIVAARLSEDPDTEVLLLEAGPEDKSYWSRIPLGFAKILFDEKYMWWNHKTEPEPGLNGKQYALLHGKLVGGSSAINGLVHVRGAPLDYNTWEEMGAEGWSFEDVLPYFIKSERATGERTSTTAAPARSASSWRGGRIRSQTRSSTPPWSASTFPETTTSTG